MTFRETSTEQTSSRVADLESIRVPNRTQGWKTYTKNWELYILVSIPVLWVLIFRYYPMYGAQIGFKRFVAIEGILGSPWVGLYHFKRFLTSYNFGNIMFNTIFLNFYQLIAGFPVPILLALLLHYCPLFRYKKIVQMVTYAPHFISTVVMVGIIFKLLAPRIGIINMALVSLGIKVNWLGSPITFPHVFVWTGIWQNMGWGSIIYLAALSAVDPELHESARVDGATIWQRIGRIDIPGILPTIIILLILRVGRMLEVGFEKVLLMQNDLNIGRSEVIQTYVYKVGLASEAPNFSYATAIGLFTSAISFALLLIVNRISRAVTETSLW